jgi:hypothetical protein
MLQELISGYTAYAMPTEIYGSASMEESEFGDVGSVTISVGVSWSWTVSWTTTW